MRFMRDNLTRRDFLRTAALIPSFAAMSGVLAGCAGAASNAKAWSGPPGSRRLSRIGLQLYTERELMQRDAPDTLAAIAKAGYTEVELAGLYGHTAREMRSYLDAVSLASPAGHVSLEDLRESFPRLVDDAHVLGWKWVILPWLDPKHRTLDGYRSLAAEFNRFGESAKGAGLRFAYHNQEYDGHPFFPSGRIPYELLLEETRVDLVDFEMDLFWMVKGGGDPIQFMTLHPGRFPLLHVKDMTTAGQMANVGAGSIDFRAIFADAAAAGTTHFFVEHDAPVNPIADITASIDYLKRIRF